MLIDNGVEFKPPMQWGEKKGKSDLKTYWDRYFHQRTVSCSRVIMELISLYHERRSGCLGLGKVKEKRDYNYCLYEGVNTREGGTLFKLRRQILAQEQSGTK